MFRVEAHDQEMLAIESIEERLKQLVRGLGSDDPDGRGVFQALLHQHHPVAGNRIGMLGSL